MRPQQSCGRFSFSMPESSNVFLVGPMGSGKSAVGRQLARLLGGEVSVVSALGQGSTFTLRIPVTHDPHQGGAPA